MMSTTALLQITPFLPPRREGVGAYALQLARQLRSHRVETTFAVVERAGDRACGFEVSDLARADFRGPVLLHYSNYGFDPRGCPEALVASLLAAKASGAIDRLFVFFHEIYATSAPWHRAFWSSRGQRSLAQRLTRQADRLATSISVYGELLRDLGVGEPVEMLPIPSTVGEPDCVPGVRSRAPRLVVFGGVGNRSAVYGALPKGFGEVLRAAGIEEIVDIGPAPETMPPEAAGIPVTRSGPLQDAEVSNALLSSSLGALAYPPEFFGKSTAFAALAAHGVPCLALSRQRLAAVPPPHLTLDDPLTVDRLERTADEALAWYRPHGIEAHAGLISSWLEDRA